VVVSLALVAVWGTVLWLRSSEDDGGHSFSWRHVLAVELLFALAFAGWCVARSHMPRIEHAGGEKWMEIAFLNSVLRSPQFPPQDPWLAGFGISYYYFGYLIVGLLIRMTAVPASIGFNLGLASLFALVCTGSYGIVYSLLARLGRRRAALGGLMGPLLVALAGNLEGLLEVLHARGFFSAGFWQWLNIRSINTPPPAFADGSWLPSRFLWWWQASRVIHDYGIWQDVTDPLVHSEVIDEFPAFSFLLGDLHPHVLALPFVLLALGLALAILMRRGREGWDVTGLGLTLPLRPWELLVYAICLGGLGFLNTWDFPIYLFVVIAAAALVSYRLHPQTTEWLPPLITFAGLLAVGGFALYLPFWAGFRSQAGGILPNLFNGTRLAQFLAMFGSLLVPVAALVIAESRSRGTRLADILSWAFLLLLVMVLVLLLFAVISPLGRQYLDAWRSGGPIPGLEDRPDARELVVARLWDRFKSPWTPVSLALLLAASALVLLGQSAPVGDADVRGRRPEIDYALLLVTTGGLLTLAVEFVYLKDVFGTRMNTVFKFYFQAWVMWGCAGAYALVRGLSRGRVWAWLATLLACAGLVYTALAIPTRMDMHDEPATLDGAAHLRDGHSAADFAAIAWLNENVEGMPVLLEAPGDRFEAYAYVGRVSAFTGLPTLLGWGGHQHQWRGDYDEPALREPDIETLYATTDLREAVALLDKYGIEYIYIGPEEWSRYPADGLAKFIDIARQVYNADGVMIYRYTSISLGSMTDPLEPEPQRPGEAVP
jgi:uncharacterized membrane protein